MLAEDRAIEALEKLIKTNSSEKPVAGAIIEPIQSEGGDRFASPRFYLGIQEVFRRHGVVFIVDEVQTGCGSSGKFWAHQHWGPRADPDIVTFAKKLQVSGLFHKNHLTPRRPEALFNPFHDDHVRLLNFKAIWNVMQEDKLMRLAEDTGKFIRAELMNLQRRFRVENVRGQGTLIAFDLESPEVVARFVKLMALAGVNVGTCGVKSIRLRPSLIFGTKHAEVLLDRTEAVLSKLNR